MHMDEEDDPMSVLSSSGSSGGGGNESVGVKCQNLASAFVGAEVIAASSQVPGCEASNTLYDSQELTWRCDPGLPQWIVLRLCPSGVPKLGLGRDTVTRVGWSCSRTSGSNPRRVSVQASRQGSVWRVVADLSCAERKGVFEIAPLKVSVEPFVRVAISETRGQESCVVDKIYFYTDGNISTSSSSSSSSSTESSSSIVAFFAKSSESIASKLAALRSSEQRQKALFATLDYPLYNINAPSDALAKSVGSPLSSPREEQARSIENATQTVPQPPRASKGTDPHSFASPSLEFGRQTTRLDAAAQCDLHTNGDAAFYEDGGSIEWQQQPRERLSERTEHREEVASAADVAIQTVGARRLSSRKYASSRRDLDGKDAGIQSDEQERLVTVAEKPHSPIPRNEQLAIYEDNAATEYSTPQRESKQNKEISDKDEVVAGRNVDFEENVATSRLRLDGHDTAVPVEAARSPRRRRVVKEMAPREGERNILREAGFTKDELRQEEEYARGVAEEKIGAVEETEFVLREAAPGEVVGSKGTLVATSAAFTQDESFNENEYGRDGAAEEKIGTVEERCFIQGEMPPREREGSPGTMAASTLAFPEDEFSQAEEFALGETEGKVSAVKKTEFVPSPRQRVRQREQSTTTRPVDHAPRESSSRSRKEVLSSEVPRHRPHPPPQPSTQPERQETNVLPGSHSLSAEDAVMLRLLTHKLREKRKKMKSLLKATLREKVRQRKLKTIELIRESVGVYER